MIKYRLRAIFIQRNGTVDTHLYRIATFIDEGFNIIWGDCFNQFRNSLAYIKACYDKHGQSDTPADMKTVKKIDAINKIDTVVSAQPRAVRTVLISRDGLGYWNVHCFDDKNQGPAQDNFKNLHAAVTWLEESFNADGSTEI